jgi:hypothetical protein
MDCEREDGTEKAPEKRKHASKSPQATQIRRRILIEAAMNGTPLRDAAVACGLSSKTASEQASNIMRQPETQREFHRILAERGITDDFLAEKGYGLLTAKHTIFAQKDGIYTDSRDVEALETQRKTWETTLKLMGHLKDNPAGGSIEIGLMQMVVQVVRDSSDTP